MNTSKIKFIISSKQSPKNEKRYTLLEMEDWAKWTISHEKQDQYQVWQELKYKTSPMQDDPTKFWISEVKDKKWWYPQRDYKIDFVMKAMECAILFHPNSQHVEWVKPTVGELADTMYNRMDKKYLSIKQSNNG